MIKIDQSFISTILNGGLAIDIVHENGSYSTWSGTAYSAAKGVYTPQSNREYAEIKVFPAGNSSFDLNDTNEDVGLFQVIVKYPNDVGSIIIKQKAEAVLALFKAGSTIAYSGQIVNIVSNNRDGGRTEGGFYQIVVRINYRAFVPK